MFYLRLLPARFPATCLAICLAAAECQLALGQHADIAVYQNSLGQVTTHDSSDPSQAESTFFQSDFDFWGPPLNVFAGDDPGFQMSGLNAPAGYQSLPGMAALRFDVVPIHIPGRPSSNVMFWDATGPDVDFSVVPADHVMYVKDAADSEISLNGSTERFKGLLAGITNADGGMHEHELFAVENAGAAPRTGFYMMGWQMWGDSLQPSRLTLLVLSTPWLPSSVKTQVSDWLSSQADTITIAGDFDGDGAYRLSDVDALVASIVAGANDPAFDLSGDGQTDAGDLVLWRDLAGDVLNTSHAPVLAADSNLDGFVNGQDFVVWNANKFTAEASWSGGDINADGMVNGQDFVTWNALKFQAADSSLVVPEPSAVALSGLWILLLSRALFLKGFDQ